MLSGRPVGTTRVLGKSQGYNGLAVRDETVHCTVGGEGTPCMVTAWFPTPAEVEAINAGAPVHVILAGRAHPPIRVETGERPE